MKKSLRLIIIVLCVQLIALEYSHAMQYPIMSYDKYKIQSVKPPYYFSLSNAHQQLFYFGANHSCDPSNEQYPVLEKFWHDFLEKTKGHNCVVLVEGRLRRLRTSKEKAVLSGSSEGSFITFLAHQSTIAIACPEPNDNFLYKKLSEQFPKEQIAYTLFAQSVLSTLRASAANKNLNFEATIQACIERYQYFDFPITFELMRAVHQQLFTEPFDMHNEQFFYDITNPVEQYSTINIICRAASVMRDIHIVQYIERLIKEGKNVFVVYGSTHAIIQEPAIRHIWNKYSQKL